MTFASALYVAYLVSFYITNNLSVALDPQRVSQPTLLLIFSLYPSSFAYLYPSCGTPNDYMDGFKCRVTNASANKQLGKPQAPVYCGQDAAPYEPNVPA